MTEHFSSNQSGGVVSTNLDAVTSATNGAALGTRDFSNKSVFVTVSGNTGAVTVNIEGSHDGSNWFNIVSKTYSITNDTDIFSYSSHFPFMRVTTSTHSNATVSAVITGGR